MSRLKFPNNKIVTLTKPLIGYKKLRYNDTTGYTQPAIATLLIPPGAKVHFSDSLESHKCRASEAYIVKIQKLLTGSFELEGNLPEARAARNRSNGSAFVYKARSIVKPEKKFDEDPGCCRSGIHFFRTVKVAKSW